MALSQSFLFFLLQMQPVVALHVQLHVEHASTPFPLTLEHLDARVNVVMDLERQWSLEHLVAYGAPVFPGAAAA